MLRLGLSLIRRPRSSTDMLRQAAAIRKSGYFDPDYYVARYTDLSSIPSPLIHFTMHGVFEGRTPSDLFDPVFYHAKYPDVARAGIPALLHYLSSGRDEGRWPRNLFGEKLPGYCSNLPRPASVERIAVLLEGDDANSIERVSPLLSGLGDRLQGVFVPPGSSPKPVIVRGREIAMLQRENRDGALFRMDQRSLEHLRSFDLILRVNGEALTRLGDAHADMILRELLACTDGRLDAERAFEMDQSLGLLAPSHAIVHHIHGPKECERTLVEWLEVRADDQCRPTPVVPLYWFSPEALAPLLSPDFFNIAAAKLKQYPPRAVSDALDRALPLLLSRNGYTWKECDGPVRLGRRLLNECQSVMPVGQCSGVTASALRWSASRRTLEQKSVLAILLNYNCAGDVIAAAETLEADDDPPSIVIVDNASEAPERDKVRAYAAQHASRVRFVQAEENLGYAGGNNLGIQLGLDEGFTHLLILNPDARLRRGALRTMLGYFDGRSSLGAVSPAIFKDPEESVLWYAGFEFDPLSGVPRVVGLGEPPAGHLERPRALQMMTGCCMLVSTRCIRAVGPIPDDYFLYYEDNDWSLRMGEAGWHIAFAPNARVVHLQTSTGTGSLPKNHYIYYLLRNRIRFMRRWNHGRLREFFSVHHEFVEAYRKKVAAKDPAKVPTFEALVRLAIDDGLADRGGHRDLSGLPLG